MTMTDTDIGTFAVDEYVPEDADIDCAVPGPLARVDQLRRELAESINALVTDAEQRIADIDAELTGLQGRRKAVADELREYRAELARLTGVPQRPARPSGTSAPKTGAFACKHCDRTFPTQQGLTMHNTRTHKLEAARAASPARPALSSTRSVYRCGELVDGEPCGKEVLNLADLSHHTLTEHRRQPMPAEKILVTPDR
jgi:hypothetical protein